MRDWIIITLIGAVSMAFVAWTLLRRSTPSPSAKHPRTAPASQLARVPRPERILPERVPPAEADSRSSAPSRPDVPNTTIPPNPEDLPVATLEFDGPPGAVPIRRGEIVIGRHSDDDVRLQDVRVSRHHARLIARSEGAFEIHNLTAVRSAPNPVLVNGEAREHAVIGDGDIITLGGVSFRLRLAQSAS